MAQKQITSEKGVLLHQVVKMMGYASTNRGRKAIKEGCVKVNGKLVTYPATQLEANAKIEVFDQPQGMQSIGPKSIPYTVLADDAQLFAFDKPAGVITASPDTRKRTAYSLVRAYLFGHNPDLEELYFVNKLPKEASGLIVLAKDSVTRARLQRDWNQLTKRYYVIAKGEFEKDGVIGKKSKAKKGEESEFAFPYRLMKQGKDFALLRVEMKKEAFSELLGLLETNGTPVPGFARRGKADRTMGRLGLHFFSVEIPPVGGKGKPMEIKTPVPREFLNLIKFNK